MNGFGLRLLKTICNPDDFYAGNIFLEDGRVIFTDWGRADHPSILYLIVRMRSVDDISSMDFPLNQNFYATCI
jgi:hypothetical protein